MLEFSHQTPFYPYATEVDFVCCGASLTRVREVEWRTRSKARCLLWLKTLLYIVFQLRVDVDRKYFHDCLPIQM